MKIFIKYLSISLALLIVLSQIPILQTYAEGESNMNADNVVETVSNALENAPDTEASSIVEEAVNEVIADMENMTEDEAVEALEDVQEDIGNEISEISDDIKKTPKRRVRLIKKIAHLKALQAKIRAKAMIKHRKLVQKVRRVKNMPAVYEIRWGNLNNRNLCPGLTRKEALTALETNETPAKCEINKVIYEGKISVDTGTLKIRKNVLFEKNDEIIKNEGSSIGFKSTIAGHWDGLIIQFIPDTNDDGSKKEVNVTISIGELSGTYSASEVTGRKAIGNDHMVEIKRIASVLQNISTANQEKIIKNKLKIQDKIIILRNKIYRLQLLKKGGNNLDGIEKVVDETGEYNFDDTSAAEAETEIEEVISELNDTTSEEEIEAIKERIRRKIAEIKARAKIRKFNQKIIPFKDTDDDQWYTKYVSHVKAKGIISGYKDSTGNELGEFRPANNITIAEILKIGLETSEKGQSETGIPNLRAAINHWAKAYVKKAEELNLDLVKGNTDLNRPATRGEVIRMMLESLGINPDEISKTSFSDLSKGHRHAKFIEYAKKLGIVSGDQGKATFRPDDPINRAEAAKIANQILENIMGETVE